MIPRKRRSPLLLAVFVGVTLILGCQPQNTTMQSVSANDSILRVGISANAPPFAFKQGGKITGLEPALAALLGDFLEKKIVFVEVPWEKQFDYLNSGKTDIVMSGMSITQQRSLAVDFTKPYLRSGQIMLVRAEDRQRFLSGVESLLNTNYRIGTVANTVSDVFISSTINGADETAFERSQDAVDALIKNEIDAFVYDAPIICYYAARHQNDKVVPILTMATEEYIGWAVRKNDTALIEQVNTFIDTIKDQGELEREINYWIPYLNNS